MTCKNTSYDNRETCTTLIPSSCVPYTGFVSDNIKEELPCRPNVNDVLKSVQELVDKIKKGLGDNTKLNRDCLSFNPETVTQEQLNGLFINELCALRENYECSSQIDVGSLALAVNILCLEDPTCTPKQIYTVQELFNKLIAAYCNLLTRVQAIEQLLNI